MGPAWNQSDWRIADGFSRAEIERLLASPGEVVKEFGPKKVTRHCLDGRIFFIKTYRHSEAGLRPLKFWFKDSQARKEWNLAAEMERRRIPIVRHVAQIEYWTQWGLGQSVLVTEGFDGIPASQSPALSLTALRDWLDRLHDAGILQRDLHPENILVSAGGEIRLVDLHGAEIRSSLGPEERSENLAYVAMFLPIPVSEEIRRRSRSMRKTLLAQRSRRCLKSNRDFARVNAGGMSWHVRRRFQDPALDLLLNDPEGAIEKGTPLKNGRSSTVAGVGEQVIKRYNFKKVLNLAKDLFRDSKGIRSFQRSYHLELVGIPTARGIAAAELRSFGFLARSYFVMEKLPGEDLGSWLKKGHAPSPALVRAAGRALARLHDEGFSHRDLKETNWILQGEQLCLIDLDGLEFLQDVPDPVAAADLARFYRGIAAFDQVRPAQVRSFLRAYCRIRRTLSVPRL